MKMDTAPQCPLITTARLKPFRQRLNRVIMTITDSGYVSMEMMSPLNNQSDCPEVAKELFHICPDGTEIEVYQSSEGVPSIDGCPMPCQPYKTYTYPHLSAKQWKKYQHAYKFVEVVKSRTAKILLVTEKARCSLMENSPHADFEACFSDGVRIVLSKSKVTITDQEGGSLTFDAASVSSRVNASTLAMVEYTKQCQTQCLVIEKSVNELQARDPNQQLFPITIGSPGKPFQLPVPSSPTSATTSDYQEQILHRQGDILSPYGHTPPPQAHMADNQGYDYPNQAYLHNERTACLEETAIRHDYENRRNIQHAHLYPETTCSEDEVRDLLLAKTAQFKDFGGSSCSSSVKSLSDATTTPQKVGCGFVHGLQSNDHESAQTLLSQNVSGSRQQAHTALHNMSSQVADGYWSGQQENSNYDTEMALVHHFPAACNIPGDCDTRRLSSSSGLNCELVDDVSQYPVPFSSPCQTNTHNNCCCSNPTQGQFADDSGVSAWQFQQGYVTPKKSAHPYQSQRIQCHSVDSIRHQQHRKPYMHNLTLGALVDERELRHVRKNLFSDQALEEPMVRPFPMSGPHALKQDLLAIRPTPSLELSDCSDNEDSSVMSASISKQNVTRNDQVILPSNPKSASVPPALPRDICTCNEIPGVSPTKVRTSGSIVPSVVLHEKLISTPKKNHNDAISLPFSQDECLTQMSLATETPDATTAYTDHAMYSSGLTSPGPPSCSSMPGPVPHLSTSPRKPAPARKVACLSPLKISPWKNGSHGVQCSPIKEQAEMPASNWFPTTHPVSPKKDNKMSNGTIGQSSSMASLETSNHIAKSRETLNQTKSEPGSFRKTTLTSNLPMSPQKEFIMPCSTSGDRSWLDLNLPPHVRNSLDMSASSYYSDSPSSSPSSGCDPIRQVFVPYTGWASFYATGAVWILYNDGTQLGVKSTEAAMIYIDQDGSQTKYKNSDVVPEIVKQKLEKLPKVIDMLMKSPAMAPPATPLL